MALKLVAIDPSGNILPCCSAAGLVNLATISYAKRERLSELIWKASKRPLFRVLRSRGPSGILKSFSPDSRRSYVSRYHLCYEALMDHRISEFL